MAKQRANWCFMPLKQEELQQQQQQHENTFRWICFVDAYYTGMCECECMCRQMVSFLTFHLNFSPSSVSEKRATSEYLMLSVYLIPPFTAALFVIRVICTSTTALVFFSYFLFVLFSICI